MTEIMMPMLKISLVIFMAGNLMGMAPCAPFVPALVAKGKGDLGFTAAFMMVAAVGTVVFMPLAVPIMTQGLTVTLWMVAKPLLIMVVLGLPLMVIFALLAARLFGRNAVADVGHGVSGDARA